MFNATKASCLVFALALILSACAPTQPVSIQPTFTQPSLIQPTPIPPTESQPTLDQLALPNPASVFCEEQGGKIEIRTDASGGQAGACIFQDGSECDEWAFYRGECQPGQPQLAASPAPNPRYISDSYGFSFDPPTEWSIEEYPDYLLFHRPGYKLFVGYQWANEEIKPFRTGMPSGDFVDGGSASLLGQPVPKQILVWEGKNKVVAYSGRIKVGDLILVFYLDAEETAEVRYDALDIPPEVIAEADQIIASFALTSGETPQLEFNP
jgi:putative hemolysin